VPLPYLPGSKVDEKNGNDGNHTFHTQKNFVALRCGMARGPGACDDFVSPREPHHSGRRVARATQFGHIQPAWRYMTKPAFYNGSYTNEQKLTQMNTQKNSGGAREWKSSQGGLRELPENADEFAKSR
jgi:hypothetical protein